jgi:EspG family
MMFTLSLAAMDILREQFGLESSTYPFEIPYNGVTREERSRIRAAVLDDLQRRGLTHRGNMAPEVESTLKTMANPNASLALVCLAGGTEIRVLAAGSASYAVRLRQNGQLLEIDQAAGVVSGMIDLLPDEKPGPGQSVTFTAGESNEQASAYLRRPRHRFGQLSLATGTGTQRTWPMELTWFDTDAGRYISYARDNWITYTPANRTRIANMFAPLVGG